MAVPGSSSLHRLGNRREYDEVFKQATSRASCAEFLLLAVENRGPASRLGMVVSKKVAGNSVNRNRIRRLIRESFRRSCERKGLDIVVVARPPASKLENAVMLRVLAGLWEKLSNVSVKPSA